MLIKKWYRNKFIIILEITINKNLGVFGKLILKSKKVNEK